MFGAKVENRVREIAAKSGDRGPLPTRHARQARLLYCWRLGTAAAKGVSAGKTGLS